MTISFELPEGLEEQIAEGGADLNREAKELYLMAQYRLAKITHRQLAAALDLSFEETEELLKRRGMGQDIAPEEFGAGREFLRKAGPQ